MATVTTFDIYMDRVTRGERLSADEIHDLAKAPDILSLGMLADALRRRLHDRRATFLRVAESECAHPFAEGVPSAARELRLVGAPPDLGAAVAAVEAVAAVAGDRTIAAFSWEDVERWAGGVSPSAVLVQLKAARLDALADLPIDGLGDPASVFGQLADAGFTRLRLSVRRAAVDARTDLFLRIGELQRSLACIQSINPLPTSLATFRPTTGYEDVKMVAVARLAAPDVPSIQVDWRRYGPKLAQVALTFGADDVDGVSASDEAPEGRRRAPLADIRRNIEAAGLVPAERSGRFVVLA